MGSLHDVVVLLAVVVPQPIMRSTGIRFAVFLQHLFALGVGIIVHQKHIWAKTTTNLIQLVLVYNNINKYNEQRKHGLLLSTYPAKHQPPRLAQGQVHHPQVVIPEGVLRAHPRKDRPHPEINREVQDHAGYAVISHRE